MFKNFDWRHALAFIACGIVLGLGQIPQVKPFDVVLYALSTPLFLYAGMALPQLGSKEAAFAKDAAKKAGAIVFVCLGLGALAGVSETACTPTEQQQLVTVAPEAVACVVAVVADFTVAPDIAGTIAKCGVTAQAIYQIVSEMLAPKDAGAAGASPERAAHLKAWAQAAIDYDRALHVAGK